MAFQPAPAQGRPSGGAPRPTPGRAGLVVMIVGAVILVLSVVVGVILTVAGVGDVSTGSGEDTVLDEGRGSLALEADESVFLYSPDDADRPTCSVTDPGGQEVPLSYERSTSTSPVDGESWSAFATVVAPSTGDYTVDCDSSVAISSPMSAIPAFSGIGGVLIGILGVALGFVVLVIGLIVFAVSRWRA